MDCCVCSAKLVNDVICSVPCAICHNLVCAKCRHQCMTNRIQYNQFMADMNIKKVRLHSHPVALFYVCSNCIQKDKQLVTTACKNSQLGKAIRKSFHN